MGQSFVFGTGDEAYLRLMKAVRYTGHAASPRGMGITELNDVSFTITEASRAVPLGTSRRVRAPIGATEYIHLLAGVSSLSQLNAASGGRFSQFADNGRLLGSYGPRVYRQMPGIIRLLSEDHDTRQAVVTIFRPDDTRIRRDTGHARQRDVPCTVGFQFMIRNGRLNMTAIMRSSDIWLGLPYDLWQFTRFQMTMAWVLRLPAGRFTLFAGSLHLYDHDQEKASQLIEHRVKPIQPPAVIPPDQDEADPVIRLLQASGAALQVIYGATDINSTVSMKYYASKVPLISENEDMCAGCRYFLPRQDVTNGYCMECREAGA